MMNMKLKMTISLLIVLFLGLTLYGYFPSWAEDRHVPDALFSHVAEEPINDIEYSPDGKFLAVASDSGIWLYDTVTHQEVRHLVEHTGLVNSISFSPDSTKLSSADSGGRVYLWNVATGTHLWSRTEHHGRASVSFSPGGRQWQVEKDSIFIYGMLRLLGGIQVST